MDENVILEIEEFRNNVYIGKKLDNSLLNSILQHIEKKTSENKLNIEYKNKINYYINLCIEALSNKDYVYLADILYFEIMSLLKESR